MRLARGILIDEVHRFRARVLVGKDRYQTRSFETEREALEWAQSHQHSCNQPKPLAR